MSFLQNLKTSEIITAAIAIYAAIIATLNFAWPRVQEWLGHRSAVFKALQGDKKAIAEVAYRVTKGEWDLRLRKQDFRQKLVTALSMAFTLEGADRAKVYVLEAMRRLYRINEDCRKAFDAELDNIARVYLEYDRIIGDESFRKKRLEPLQKLLEELKRQSATESVSSTSPKPNAAAD